MHPQGLLQLCSVDGTLRPLRENSYGEPEFLQSRSEVVSMASLNSSYAPGPLGLKGPSPAWDVVEVRPKVVVETPSDRE